MFNRQIFDTSLDKLVRESSIPQGLARNVFDCRVPAGSSRYRQDGMSVSAIPIARPAAAFNPFMSPQALLMTDEHGASDSISDIFNRLKQPTVGRIEEEEERDDDAGDDDELYQQGPSKQTHHRQHAIVTDNVDFNRRDVNRGVNWKSNKDQGPGIRSKSCQDDSPLDEVQDSFHQVVEEITDKLNDDEQEDDEGEHLEQPAVSLYNWIIKPIPEAKAICVEGKKSLEDAHFWHSGIIVKKISDKLVVSQNLSVYRLEGSIEVVDCLDTGLPRYLVEAFWSGFPDNWNTLVERFFQEDSLDISCQESVLTEASQADDEGGDVTLTDNNIDEAEVTACEGTTKITTITASTTEAVTSQENTGQKPPVEVVKNWFIKPMPAGKGIRIVGCRSKGSSSKFWSSSAIESRLGKQMVKSMTGSVYKLVGKMDKLQALDVGIPAELISKFRSGFPKEWQEHVQQFLFSKKSSSKKKNSGSTATKASSKQKSRPPSDACKPAEVGRKMVSQKKKMPVTKTGSGKKSIAERSSDEENAVGKVSSTSKHNMSGIVLKESRTTVVTPHGAMVDLELLGRSRSGRLIKPPLQWWTGQTLTLDEGGLVVRAPTRGSSQFLQAFEDGYQRSTRCLKPYFNQRPKDSLSGSSLANTSASSLSSLDGGQVKSSNATQSFAKGPKATKSATKTNEECHQNSTARRSRRQQICTYRARKSRDQRKNGSPAISEAVSTKDPGVSRLMQENIVSSTINSSDDNDQERTVLRRRVDSSKVNKLSKNRKQISSCTGNSHGNYDADENDNFRPTRRSLRSVGCEAPIIIETESSNDLESIDRNQQRTLIDEQKSVPVYDESISKRNSSLSESEDDAGPNRRTTRAGKVKTVSGSNKTKAKKKSLLESENTNNEVSNKRASLGLRRLASKSNQSKATKNRRSSSVDDESDESPNRRTSTLRKRKSLTDKTKSRPTTSSSSRSSLSGVQHQLMDKNVDDEGKELLEPWTQEEKKRLHLACKRYNPSMSSYWDKVAEMVGSRTVEECSKMFLGEDKPRSEKKRHVKEKPRATSITANVGTLKRKLQLKDLYEQHNENYEDNIFDSTPFRNTRKRKAQVPSLDDSDPLFLELAQKQGKARFETPKGPDEVFSLTRAQPVSTSKTPVSTLDIGDLQPKKDLDGYVHKLAMMKRRQQRLVKKKQPTPKLPKTKSQLEPVQMKLFREYLSGNSEDKENFQDSENEDDEYWGQDSSQEGDVTLT